MAAFFSRLEHLERIDSTQRLVRDWLAAGEPEVCVATAGEQTAGRGRRDRSWSAPAGAALLVSAGFRPVGMDAALAWRLPATAALAMIDAAEEVAGLRDGTIGLKWPNDLVIDGLDGPPRKLAGVLAESILEGERVTAVIVGIGVNADWQAATFPAELAASMTSLLEASGGRPIDRLVLLDAWLARLEPRYEALRGGAFDAGAWSTRQRTTGRQLEVDIGDQRVVGIGHGVDPMRGSLLLRVAGADTVTGIDSGEVTRCRIVELPGRR